VYVVCTLPLLLSSLAMFVFGTYLPHRDRHGAAIATMPQPGVARNGSLLACLSLRLPLGSTDGVPSMAWVSAATSARSLCSAGIPPLQLAATISFPIRCIIERDFLWR